MKISPVMYRLDERTASGPKGHKNRYGE